MPRWSKPFNPLDFTVIDFMQVNDCEGGRREGTVWTVHSKGRMSGVGQTTRARWGRRGGWSGRRGGGADRVAIWRAWEREPVSGKKSNEENCVRDL